MNASDRYRLERIADLGNLLQKTMREDGITAESLNENYRHQWLVTTPLYNIGEQAYCLSKDFKAKHSEVEWSGIAGLRHRLVHDYEGTNWKLIAAIIEKDVPELLQAVRALLDENTEK